MTPVHLDQVALDLPELRIVAGHIGYRWTDEEIALFLGGNAARVFGLRDRGTTPA